MAKYVRFEHEGKAAYGVLDGERIGELRSGLFESLDATGRRFALDQVKLLAPSQPRTIFAVGLNYKSHLNGRPEPSKPEIFYKPVTSLQNPNDPIVIPPQAEDVHFEGELVIVIGRKMRHVDATEAAAGVFGATCGNDVSDRNWQRGAGKDNQWWRAKGCDTFAPLGPVIVTDIDYSNLALRTRVNGEVLQETRTDDLIFNVPRVISFISNWVTLYPGDLIYTGTPGNTRKLSPGDMVEVEIENIGTLRNPVAAGKAA